MAAHSFEVGRDEIPEHTTLACGLSERLKAYWRVLVRNDTIVMLAGARPGVQASRQAIEADSTAVLAFGDGTTVPCDRYIMRAFCGVINRLLDSEVTCERDDRGRTVLPVPGQEAAPFWTAVDVLHGVRGAWHLGLEEVVATLRCMEFLGVTTHDSALEGRLWALRSSAPLEGLMEHAPRLLRNKGACASVLRRLIKLRPMWADFLRDVLHPLEPYADARMITTIMLLAPNFFPPSLIVDWALRACPNLSQHKALHLASMHGVMYHPCEVPSVLRRVAELVEQRGWDEGAPLEGGGLAPLLRMTLASLEKYDAMPWAAQKVHGSQVKYHDVQAASVCLVLEPGRLPRHVLKMAPWLRVHVDHAGGDAVGVHVKPRSIDPASAACTSLQLRLMCFDSTDAPRASASGEVWYMFEGIGGGGAGQEWRTLDQADRVLGDVGPVEGMVRARTARLLRLDFFFGSKNMVEHPFDTVLAAAMG